MQIYYVHYRNIANKVTKVSKPMTSIEAMKVVDKPSKVINKLTFIHALVTSIS